MMHHAVVTFIKKKQTCVLTISGIILRLLFDRRTPTYPREGGRGHILHTTGCDMYIYFISVRDWVVSWKSCNLIRSGSGHYFQSLTMITVTGIRGNIMKCNHLFLLSTGAMKTLDFFPLQ